MTIGKLLYILIILVMTPFMWLRLIIKSFYSLTKYSAVTCYEEIKKTIAADWKEEYRQWSRKRYMENKDGKT